MTQLSGSKVLSEIDKFLQSARGQLSEVDTGFGATRSRLASLRTKELGLYAELARLRLLDIEQGDVIDRLDQADRDAEGLLQKRKLATAELDSSIQMAEAELADKERIRIEQQAVVDSASAALDAAEAQAQAALETDAVYKEQLARTDDADFIADQAEDKAAAAETDRVEKGKPYEDDTLFVYLWERGYGTSNYRAFPLTRWLDGKVARLIDFEPARRNYALLIEIPARLADHAGAMRAVFDQHAERLAELEQAAGAAAGIPRCTAELETAETALAAVDADIAAVENRIRELVAERRSFVAGKDSYYSECIDILSAAMQRKSVAFLRERAARTPDRSDDDIVRRLEALDDETETAERTLKEYERLHNRESGRLNELEDLRRRFKSERFDDAFSEFKDWALIALVLREFLRGSAGSNDVWRTIQRQQRTRRDRANPNFGSMRFPKAPKQGPWRMPKGGGFRGGGFKSGGGFRGGGGFKTGGGF